jgi:hypothetical protein
MQVGKRVTVLLRAASATTTMKKLVYLSVGILALAAVTTANAASLGKQHNGNSGKHHKSHHVRTHHHKHH